MKPMTSAAYLHFIREKYGDGGYLMDQDHVLRELRAHGCVQIDPLTPQQVRDLNWWLLSRPVFADAHVPQTARNRGDAGPRPRKDAGASEYVCVATSDAILAPHLLEHAIDLTDIAAAYLGRDPPVLYSANAFWTRPGPTVRRDIQAFHVDADDERFLAMFCYLTDVTHSQHGPHDLKGPDGIVRTVFGPAGTVFLADTSLEHRGRKPELAERGIAWMRWGVSDRPPAGVWDGIEPVPAHLLGSRYPDDPRLREAIRLLVSAP